MWGGGGQGATSLFVRWPDEFGRGCILLGLKHTVAAAVARVGCCAERLAHICFKPQTNSLQTMPYPTLTRALAFAQELQHMHPAAACNHHESSQTAYELCNVSKHITPRACETSAEPPLPLPPPPPSLPPSQILFKNTTGAPLRVPAAGSTAAA